MGKSFAKSHVFLAAGLILGLQACSGGGSESSAGSAALDKVSIPLVSSCGEVSGGEVVNPPTEASAVTIQALDSDTVIAAFAGVDGAPAEGEILLKLHGVDSSGVSGAARQKGINYLSSLAGQSLFYVPAGEDCLTVDDGGGTAVAGQLFLPDGTSVIEKLLSMGAVAAAADVCSAEALTGCYETLRPTLSSTVIRDFLWKPVSHSSGAVVVLVDPRDIQVHVRGAISEDLRNTGPSNDRGTTARGTRSGCSFGGPVTVSFTDRDGLAVATASGLTEIVLGSGCDRARLFF